MENDDKKYWVALSTHLKIGSRTIFKLYKRFKKLKKVWQAASFDFKQAGLEEAQIRAISEIVAKANPDKEMEKLARLGIETIIFSDANFPKNLREIPDPPAILYVRGQILPTDEIALAVVGSRKYTDYGRRAVEKIVSGLSRQMTIVSGLALGIDTLAHQVALENHGRTLAVLGCSLDRVYPTSNIRLADKIAAGRGALISEFPLGTPALKYNFPLRNRIIAGLSLGTLIVEGMAASGSLITAQAALEYNREVFAVPGSIFSETSDAPNKLIQMGAKLVTDPHDISSELNLSQSTQEIAAQIVIPDTENEKILLKLLQEPRLVDELIKTTKMPAPLVNTTLIMLEMKGVISHLGGTRYVIKGKLKEEK